MTSIRTTYQRVAVDGTERGEPIELAADVMQDGGAGCTSELLVIWTDESLAKLAALELDMEELVGATEAIEQAFWDREAELCRLARTRQQLGIDPPTPSESAA